MQNTPSVVANQQDNTSGSGAEAKRLRDYQEAGIAAINERFAAGVHRQLFSAATGSGKTEVMAFLIKQRLAAGKNCLVLAHRDRLVTQAAERIEGIVGWGKVGLVNGDTKNWWSPCVVATVQSAGVEKQLERAPRFDTIIVDECHRAGAPLYNKVLSALRGPDSLLLGLTATPNRTDKKGLIPAVFDELVYEIGMQELIDKGYLAPVVGKEIRLPIDFSKMKTAVGMDGIRDYKSEDIKAAFEEAKWLERITEGWRAVASDRRTIIFVPPGIVDDRSCGMAHSLAEYMQLQGIKAAAVDGTTKQKVQDQVIEDFTKGDIQVLVNVNIFCLDDQTEILTNQGWRGIDGIQDDDQVANWDNGKVYFEKPSRIIKRQRMPDERMVVLETKNRSIRVSENHRMVWTHQDYPRFFINEAKDLVGKKAYLPLCGKAEPFDYQVPQEDRSRSRASHNSRVASNAWEIRRRTGCSSDESLAIAKERIIERESLAYTQPKDLSIADCHFIGFWIGDGTRSALRSGGVEYLIAQSMVYPRIIEWFDSVVAETGFDVLRKERHRENIDYVTWSFGRGTGFGSQKRNGLYRIEPYLQKDGTELFWALNDDQFYALLLGFWYADGMHGKAESVPDSLSLCNSSYPLLSTLQAIASTRGYGTRISNGYNHQVNHDHKQNYKLIVYKRQVHAMTKYRLEFEGDDWRDERLWCVTVRSGCIITRRRGTVTVMGNCEGLDIPPIDCVLFARPTQSSIIYSQSIGRGTRLFPGKKDCLVIDVTGITEQLGKEGLTLMTLGKILPTEEQIANEKADRLKAAKLFLRKLWRKHITLKLEDEQVKVHGQLAPKEEKKLDELRDAIIELLTTRDDAAAETASGERKPVNNSLLSASEIEIRDIDFARANLKFKWNGDPVTRRAVLSYHNQDYIIHRPDPTGRYYFESMTNPGLDGSAATAAEAKSAVERYITQKEMSRKAAFQNPNAAWRQKPISEKQRATLDKLKVKYDPQWTAGDASDALDAAFSKKRQSRPAYRKN